MYFTNRLIACAMALSAILLTPTNSRAAAVAADTPASQIVGKAYRLEHVYLVSFHVPSANVDKILQALAAAVGLPYGKYDHVAFIEAEGVEQFRPLAGSRGGAAETIRASPSKDVTVSLVHDATVLHKALDAIHQAHSYEEPVIYITEGWRTRSTNPDENNPNRWWNQRKPK